MATRRFKVRLEWDPKERVWVTYVPKLDISTFGETREEALKNTEEAILGYLEAAAKAGLPASPQRWVTLEVLAP